MKFSLVPVEGSTVSATSNNFSSGNNEMSRHSTISTVLPAHAVNLLARQIPEFGGTEEENVQLWVQRVEKVSRIHKALEDVSLLAASSRLVKTARRWYDLESGTMLESWTGFREAVMKRFVRKVPFYVAMRKIETRKWIHSKELFHEYALDKLALMHALELPTKDAIQLLISGIMSSSLRGTAASLKVDSIDQFLEEMHHVAVAASDPDRGDQDKKNVKLTKGKEMTCKTCGRKGHFSKDCRESELVCFSCHAKGHRRVDCPKGRKKDSHTEQVSTLAAVSAGKSSTETLSHVAFVRYKYRNRWFAVESYKFKWS